MAKRAGLYRIKWLTPILGVVALLCSVGRLAAQPDRDSLICRLQTRLEDAANLTKVKANTEVIDTLTPLLAEFPEASDPTFQWLEAEYRFHIGYAAYYRGLETNDPSDKDLTIHSLTGAETLLHSTHGEGTPLYAKVLRQQGMYAYFMEDNVRDAQEKYDDAYRVWITIPNKDSVELAVVLQCMGQTAGKLGEYERAIELYKQSLEIRKRIFGERHQRVGVAYWNLGNALCYSDRFEEATEAYTQALEIINGTTPKDLTLIAGIQSNLATNYSHIGLLDKAIEYHKKALAIKEFQVGKNSLELWGLLCNLALAYADKGEFSKAERNLKECDRLASLHKLQHGAVLAKIGFFRAKTMILEGGPTDKIIGTFNLCKSAIVDTTQLKNNGSGQAIPTTDPMLLQQILLEQAQFLGKIGRESGNRVLLEMALDDYVLTSKLADQLRSEYHGQEDKLYLSGKGSEFLNDAIELSHRIWEKNHDRKSSDIAFMLMESCKFQLLQELYRSVNAMQSLGATVQDLAKHDSLIRQTAELDYQLQLGRREGGDVTTLQNELLKVQLALKEIQHELKSKSPYVSDFGQIQKKLSINDIQEALPSNTTLLNYTVADSFIFVIGIDSQQTSFRSTKKPRQFDQVLEDWKILCGSPIENKAEVARFTRLGDTLYTFLLKPELEKFKNEKLIIIPDAKLGNLPFEAIPIAPSPPNPSLSSTKFLITEYQCQYAPSATMWRLQQSKALDSSPLKCLGMAWGVIGERQAEHRNLTLHDLPGTEEEIHSVQQMISGDYRFGLAATELYFKQHSSSYGILHLALHARGIESDPQILFPTGGGNSEDGVMHFHEVLPLRLTARMAVLSACETGAGKSLKGEGVQSMSSGFAAIGVPTLLFTLWEVNDQAGKDIILRFYSNIATGKPVDAALREAKLEYLASANGHRASPYFWSAYLASGNMSPISLEPPAHHPWPFLAAGFAATLCIFIAYRIYKKNRKST